MIGHNRASNRSARVRTRWKTFFLREFTVLGIVSLVSLSLGLHETAQVLKREANLPEPKSDATPLSTPTANRKVRFNHMPTASPIISTPGTPVLSRYRFSDPGTPTGKVSKVRTSGDERLLTDWREGGRRSGLPTLPSHFLEFYFISFCCFESSPNRWKHLPSIGKGRIVVFNYTHF